MQPTTFSVPWHNIFRFGPAFIAPAAIYLRFEHWMHIPAGFIPTPQQVDARGFEARKKQKQFSFPPPLPLLILSLPSDKRPCFCCCVLLVLLPLPPNAFSFLGSRREGGLRIERGGGDDSGNVISRARYREVAAAEGNSLLSDVCVLIEGAERGI